MLTNASSPADSRSFRSDTVIVWYSQSLQSEPGSLVLTRWAGVVQLCAKGRHRESNLSDRLSESNLSDRLSDKAAKAAI